MAHFAELNNNNEVIRVLVVNNDALDSNNEESSGIIFLKQLFGESSIWKQASYNSTIRKNYPGPGFIYDEERDAFIPPKPFNSWILDEETCVWKAPVPYPELSKERPIFYDWNEDILNWEEVQLSE